MVEAGIATASLTKKARKRLKLAGYNIPKGTPFKTVHCFPDDWSFLSNGFT